MEVIGLKFVQNTETSITQTGQDMLYFSLRACYFCFCSSWNEALESSWDSSHWRFDVLCGEYEACTF